MHPSRGLTQPEGPPAPREESGLKRVGRTWRGRYQRSPARDLVSGLAAVDFGDRIILFGAALLLSVLPLIILLSALASHQADEDIAQRLGLNRQGTHIIDALFRQAPARFNLSVLVSLLLSLAGTIAVARSVQVIYERSYELKTRRGMTSLLRCLGWVLGVGGVLVATTWLGRSIRDAPGGREVLGLVTFTSVVALFWWGMHFLLAARVGWRRLLPAALATALFWVGLGVFAEVYFSSTIVSDSRLYGTIGVVFTLLTWFIAIGAVITLGAVTGAVWEKRLPKAYHRTS
jgi:membrane protein